MSRIFIFSAIALMLLAGFGALPTGDAQADGFANAWSLQNETSAVERCSLQPVAMNHPDTGASMIILRPSC